MVELRAFEDLDPPETYKEDGRNAHIVATLVNLHRNTERYPDPHPITTFLMKWGDEAAALKKQEKSKPQGKTWQQLKLIGQVLAASYNMMEESDRQKRERREAKRKAIRG